MFHDIHTGDIYLKKAQLKNTNFWMKNTKNGKISVKQQILAEF